MPLITSSFLGQKLSLHTIQVLHSTVRSENTAGELAKSACAPQRSQGGGGGGENSMGKKEKAGTNHWGATVIKVLKLFH